MTLRAGSMVHAICLIVLAGLFLDATHARSQDSTAGFYVIMKVKKNCPNPITTQDGTKTYCVPKEPVIDESDFESVSEIRFDSLLKQKYIMLKFTANGFKSFKFLVDRLPDSKLVLVIDNKVTGIFDNVGKNFVGRSIQIRGGINTPAIDWVYERLKKPKL